MMICALMLLWRKRRRLYYRLIYLKSNHWKEVKARRRKISKGVCEVKGCNGRPTDTHHRTYERLHHEKISDVIDLCRWHHNGTHKGFDLELKNGDTLQAYWKPSYRFTKKG